VANGGSTDLLDPTDNNVRAIDHNSVATATGNDPPTTWRERLQPFLQRVPDRANQRWLTASRIIGVLRDDEQRQIIAAAGAGCFAGRIPKLIGFSTPTQGIGGST
jgi:hypothetical protein